MASLALAYSMREDVSYYFSSRQPIELGAEGDYHFERGEPNRYAQLHGVPTAKGWYVEEADGALVVVGVHDTPVAVRRVTIEDENKRLSDGKRPQPRQNPFFARGRLLNRVQAEKYEEALREYESWSGGKVQWLLLAETPPGKDVKTMGLFSAALLFALLNLWLLKRGLTRR
ncbi:MAG: hypothetical protein ACO1OB_21640 [Archangium sp.]